MFLTFFFKHIVLGWTNQQYFTACQNLAVMGQELDQKNVPTWDDQLYKEFFDVAGHQISWFIDLPEIWLVVWKIFLFFHSVAECHHPNWRFVIFFRGVGSNHQPEMSILWEILLAESVEADGLKRQKYPSPKLQVLDSMGISGSDWLQVPTLYKVYVRPI